VVCTMYEEILYKCGLTQNETKVYLALLKLTKASSGKIVKEAGISGGKVYETLNKLIEKGLIKVVTENGIKQFITHNPETLLTYTKEREKEIQQVELQLRTIVPSLKKLKQNEEPLETVFFIRGMRGIRELVFEMLEGAKEIKIMGVRSTKNEQYNNFWRNWHRQRVALKKHARVMFSDRNTEYWKFFKQLKYTAIKEILHFSPSAIMIIDNNVLIFSYDDGFKCIHITSNAIAKSFTGFFDDLWRIAK